jgi:hypothetical protein
MASELLLINPRTRKRVTRVRKNPRRKMSALQRKYFGKRTRTRRRAATRVVARTNPRRRRRVTYRRNPMRTRRYHRNPVERAGGIGNAFMPALVGAGGAWTLNFLWSNYASGVLPAGTATGLPGAIVQIGAGLGLGWVAGKAFGQRTGTEVAAGALTVIMYNIITNTLSGSGTLLAGGTAGTANYGLAGMGRRRMGRYLLNGMAPAGLNARLPGNIAANVPRNLNGLRGLGYMGVARNAGGPMRGMGRYLNR